MAPSMVPTQPSAGAEEQRIAALERKAFGSTYPEHEFDDRVEHLEREAFGKVFSGDLQSRLGRLESKLGSSAFSHSAPPPVAPPQSPQPAPSFATDALQPAPPVQPYAHPKNQPVFMGDLRPQDFPSDLQPLAREPKPAPAAERPRVLPGMRNIAPAFDPAGLPAADSLATAMPRVAPNLISPVAADDSAGRELSDYQTAVASIPSEEKSGDYVKSVDHFAGGTYAHWTSFPVRVHIPLNAAPVWKSALETAIHAWGENVPLMIVPANDHADVEIAWINHLQPKQWGITNLEVFNGHMRATIYLLRPDGYPPKSSANLLVWVAEHELGHALGLWGHSPMEGDIMHLPDNVPLKPPAISQRDINTLKKVYQAPGLPAGFEIPQPVGWTCVTHYAQFRK